MLAERIHLELGVNSDTFTSLVVQLQHKIEIHMHSSLQSAYWTYCVLDFGCCCRLRPMGILNSLVHGHDIYQM